MEEHTQAPVAKWVAEEQEVAAPELRDERDGHEAADISLCEVVDVVVLGDRKAFPLAIGLAVDLAEQSQDDGSLIQRNPGVRVRDLDDRRLAVARDVQEATLVTPAGNVRDDVDVLARIRERPLERKVEIRRQHERAGCTMVTGEPCSLCERTVHEARVEVAIQEVVQLVVERADALINATYSDNACKVTVIAR